MEADSIAQILCAQLILMDDSDKAAKYLYDLVQLNLDSKTEDRETMRQFVLKIIKNVVSHDEKYADDMAKKYLLYVIESTTRP